MQKLSLIILLSLSINIADAKWQNYDQADDEISFVIATGESDMNEVSPDEDSCLLYTDDAGTASGKSRLNECITTAENNNTIAERDPVLISAVNSQHLNNQITVTANNSMNNKSVSYISHRNPFIICLGIVCEVILVFVYASGDY